MTPSDWIVMVELSAPDGWRYWMRVGVRAEYAWQAAERAIAPYEGDQPRVQSVMAFNAERADYFRWAVEPVKRPRFRLAEAIDPWAGS